MEVFTNGSVISLIIMFAVMWAVQMFFAGRQAQAFMQAMRRLRQHGATAIGRARGSRVSHVFVALAADEDDVVTQSVRMGGVTLAARPGQWQEPVDHTLHEVATWNGEPARQAAAQAARFLLGTESPVEAQLSAKTQTRRGLRGRRAGAPTRPSAGRRPIPLKPMTPDPTTTQSAVRPAGLEYHDQAHPWSEGSSSRV